MTLIATFQVQKGEGDRPAGSAFVAYDSDTLSDHEIFLQAGQVHEGTALVVSNSRSSRSGKRYTKANASDSVPVPRSPPRSFDPVPIPMNTPSEDQDAATRHGRARIVAHEDEMDMRTWAVSSYFPLFKVSNLLGRVCFVRSRHVHANAFGSSPLAQVRSARQRNTSERKRAASKMSFLKRAASKMSFLKRGAAAGRKRSRWSRIPSTISPKTWRRSLQCRRSKLHGSGSASAAAKAGPGPSSAMRRTLAVVPADLEAARAPRGASLVLADRSAEGKPAGKDGKGGKRGKPGKAGERGKGGRVGLPLRPQRAGQRQVCVWWLGVCRWAVLSDTWPVSRVDFSLPLFSRVSELMALLI